MRTPDSWHALCLAGILTVAIAGCVVPGTQPHVTNTVLTKTADLVTARTIPTSVFSMDDSVVC